MAFDRKSLGWGIVVSGVLAMSAILAYAPSAAAQQCPTSVGGGQTVTGCITVTTTNNPILGTNDGGFCTLYEAESASGSCLGSKCGTTGP